MPPGPSVSSISFTNTASAFHSVSKRRESGMIADDVWSNTPITTRSTAMPDTANGLYGNARVCRTAQSSASPTATSA